ncbi:hypothetical protein CY34DRAFT_108624 [Suillus luteus UH-Slu-Lm8-n1]|uniref:Uncharacterized protein n=1 Tax=Suillus luteus UH-Slu-Lm8-n1 TaxID=930992 RepID=A0A0D0A9V6_9AGAM|nr:hypothetical protein CY34DRAFT_108624 [Suillus luteus UH-Slu-Lm8-n1]
MDGFTFPSVKTQDMVFPAVVKGHNHMYARVKLDESIMNLYSQDGTLPGLQDRVVEDYELNPQAPSVASDIPVLVEKMGVSDPEYDKISGEQAVPEYHNTPLFPDTLQCLAQRLKQECKLSSLSPLEQNALQLLQQAAKIHIHNEIQNYYGYFGLPYIFFTLNPSAAHSPIFQIVFEDIIHHHFPDIEDVVEDQFDPHVQ